MSYRVDIKNGSQWEPHFHGSQEECEQEAEDCRDSGERARVVADGDTRGLSEAAIKLLARTSRELSEEERREDLANLPTAQDCDARGIVGDLADDADVTYPEAAAVLEWAREWCGDVFGAEAYDAGYASVLHVANAKIDGGLAFVLADVRRLAQDRATDGPGSCRSCGRACGSLTAPNPCCGTYSESDEPRPIGEAFNDPRVPCCGRDIADCDCDPAKLL